MQKLFQKNKKRGSFQDMIFIAVVALVFGVVILISFKINNTFTSQITSTGLFPSEAIDSSNKLGANFTGMLDNMFLFLIVGLAIVTLILASTVRIHPAFMALFFVSLLFLVYFSGVLSNTYQELSNNPELATEASQLTFISNILQFLPIIIAVFGFLLMIVSYKLFANVTEEV